MAWNKQCGARTQTWVVLCFVLCARLCCIELWRQSFLKVYPSLTSRENYSEAWLSPFLTVLSISAAQWRSSGLSHFLADVRVSKSGLLKLRPPPLHSEISTETSWLSCLVFHRATSDLQQNVLRRHATKQHACLYTTRPFNISYLK